MQSFGNFSSYLESESLNIIAGYLFSGLVTFAHHVFTLSRQLLGNSRTCCRGIGLCMYVVRFACAFSYPWPGADVMLLACNPE